MDLGFETIGNACIISRHVSVNYNTRIGDRVKVMDATHLTGNMVIEEAILLSRLRVSEGKTLAGPLIETGVFPHMVNQMIAVGEQTGQLDQMLNKIADFYDDEVDVAVGSLTSLIEPVMMVGIGGTVGVVLVAMYLPIFSIAGKIKTT